MSGNFRISDATRYTGMVSRYQELLAQQIKLQEQVSSGKRLQRADEDPVAAGLAQQFHVLESHSTQNSSNIDQGKSFSEVTSSAIDSAAQTVQRAYELAISANDATKSDGDRASIANEVEHLLSSLVDLGGTKYGGRNIFSGSQTDRVAFVASTDPASGLISSVDFQGNSDDLATEYDSGRTLAYNMLGSNEAGGAFGVMRDTSAGVDLFQNLIDLRDNLLNNPAGIPASIQALTDGLQHLNTAATRAGGVQSRFISASTLQEDRQTMFQNTISKLEGTDLADAVTHMQALQNSYQAALAMGARIGQTSLLDYLR